MLKIEICKHYSKLNKLNVELKILYDELVRVIPYGAFQEVLNDLYENTEEEKNLKFKKLTRKLNNLIKYTQKNINPQMKHITKQVSSQSQFSFYNRVKNMTQVQFSSEELGLLSKGLKFAMKTKFNNKLYEEFAVDIDSVLESLDIQSEIKMNIRNHCFSTLLKNKSKHHTKKDTDNLKRYKKQMNIFKNISQKMKTNELIISKADKGNCLVI